MTSNPANVIKFVLPSICLLYSLCWGSLDATRGYRETFGDADYYLDVSLEVNPEGYFQKKQAEPRVFFAGVLAYGKVEEQVYGYRIVQGGRRYYLFDYQEGKFQGELRSAKAGCEPVLHYTVRKNDHFVQKGVLRAGFCY